MMLRQLSCRPSISLAKRPMRCLRPCVASASVHQDHSFPWVVVCPSHESYRQQSTDQQQRFYSATPRFLKGFSEAMTDEADNSELDRSVEEQYSRKTPLEHVLLRPGMYVGPAERLPPNTCWVLDPLPSRDTPASTSFRMARKEYGLVPALIKIFDEILVNASDNRLRHAKSCTRIDVIIDPGSEEEGRPPYISVFNDGKGIPVQVCISYTYEFHKCHVKFITHNSLLFSQIHKKEGLYVPEMLFGHLLTGSNFDDNERRITGESSCPTSNSQTFAHFFLHMTNRWSPWIRSETDEHFLKDVHSGNGRFAETKKISTNMERQHVEIHSTRNHSI